jgi:hypothetical protein
MTSHYALSFVLSLAPTIILFALNFPGIAYKSMYTRYATFFTTVIAAVSVMVLFHKQVENPFIAYVIGLYQSWYMLWAMVLLIIHKPHEEFCRLQPKYIQAETASGVTISTADYYLTWQKFPERLSFERLCWTLDLFINFRGICWNYQSDNSRIPASVKAKVERQPQNSSCTDKVNDTRLKSPRSLLVYAATRLVFDLAWLDMCQAILFPWIRGHLQEAGLQTTEQSIFNHFVTRSIELVTSMTAIMSMVDLLNTTGLLCTAFANKNHLFGTYGYHWAYPKPWGSFKAVLDDGIIGM